MYKWQCNSIIRIIVRCFMCTINVSLWSMELIIYEQVIPSGKRWRILNLSVGFLGKTHRQIMVSSLLLQYLAISALLDRLRLQFGLKNHLVLDHFHYNYLYQLQVIIMISHTCRANAVFLSSSSCLFLFSSSAFLRASISIFFRLFSSSSLFLNNSSSFLLFSASISC